MVQNNKGHQSRELDIPANKVTMGDFSTTNSEPWLVPDSTEGAGVGESHALYLLRWGIGQPSTRQERLQM